MLSVAFLEAVALVYTKFLPLLTLPVTCITRWLKAHMKFQPCFEVLDWV